MVRTDNYAMNPHPIAISVQIKILYESCLEEVLKKYKREFVFSCESCVPDRDVEKVCQRNSTRANLH